MKTQRGMTDTGPILIARLCGEPEQFDDNLGPLYCGFDSGINRSGVHTGTVAV